MLGWVGTRTRDEDFFAEKAAGALGRGRYIQRECILIGLFLSRAFKSFKNGHHTVESVAYIPIPVLLSIGSAEIDYFCYAYFVDVCMNTAGRSSGSGVQWFIIPGLALPSACVCAR